MELKRKWYYIYWKLWQCYFDISRERMWVNIAAIITKIDKETIKVISDHGAGTGYFDFKIIDRLKITKAFLIDMNKGTHE